MEDNSSNWALHFYQENNDKKEQSQHEKNIPLGPWALYNPLEYTGAIHIGQFHDQLCIGDLDVPTAGFCTHHSIAFGLFLCPLRRFEYLCGGCE